MDEVKEPTGRTLFQQVSLIFTCGVALISDGYMNALSGPVMTILTEYMYPDQDGISQFKSNFSALVFAGTVVGMLAFGWIVDRFGRKIGMVFASLWLSLFAILIAGAWGAGGSIGGLFAALQAYRFLQGIAIGAEYPCGAVASSENTEHEVISENRQQMWLALSTNSMIGVGFVLANFVPLILLWIFGMDQLDWVWRLSFGIGAIPPLSVLYFRLKMEEPEHYQKGAIKKQVPWWLIAKRYWNRVFGLSLAWFVYDYVVYPSTIYSSLIVRQVLPSGGSLYEELGWTVLLNIFYLPGTFISALICDRLGPKKTWLTGLIMQAIIGFIMAGAFGKIRQSNAGFIMTYGLFIAFGEFGSGNCTKLFASKGIGPTAARGTLFGIVSAIGKIGAFSGSYAYPQIQKALGPEDSDIHYSGTFYIAAGLAILNACVVYLTLPELKPNGMKEEDAKFRQYLIDNGYDISLMGLKDGPDSVSGIEQGSIEKRDSD